MLRYLCRVSDVRECLLCLVKCAREAGEAGAWPWAASEAVTSLSPVSELMAASLQPLEPPDGLSQPRSDLTSVNFMATTHQHPHTGAAAGRVLLLKERKEIVHKTVKWLIFEFVLVCCHVYPGNNFHLFSDLFGISTQTTDSGYCPTSPKFCKK